MPIPKLTHHVWPGRDPLPPDHTRNFPSFDRYLPDHKRIIWTEEECLGLLQSNYPEFLEFYTGAKSYALKSDLMRYLILETHGGIYADLDVRILDQGLSTEMLNQNAIFLTEAILSESYRVETRNYRIRNGIAEDAVRVANYMMIAGPNHPVLREIIVELTKRAKNVVSEQYDVIYITGPDVVSTVVNRTSCKDFKLLDLAATELYVLHEEDGRWKDSLHLSSLLDRSGHESE